VFLDGKKLISVDAGQAVTVEISPGRHVLHALIGTESSLDILGILALKSTDVVMYGVPGQTLMYQLEVFDGWVKKALAFYPLPPTAGKATEKERRDTSQYSTFHFSSQVFNLFLASTLGQPIEALLAMEGIGSVNCMECLDDERARAQKHSTAPPSSLSQKLVFFGKIDELAGLMAQARPNCLEFREAFQSFPPEQARLAMSLVTLFGVVRSFRAIVEYVS
jgi:hypothetical protein